jgi:hypothetical protein
VQERRRKIMRQFSRDIQKAWRRGLVLAMPLLLITAVACDSDSPVDPGNGNGDNGHLDDAARVEISTRGPASTLIAVWTDGEGWADADGSSISELPNPVDVEGGNGLQPLQAGGTRASLTVTFFERDGSEIEMETLSRDDDTGARECTPYNARYYPLDDGTDVIAWPNMRHPDDPDGPFQFAERADGEVVAIFHCDHIHIYPEREGSADIEFRLWHVDHSDMETDPITVVVGEGEEPEPAARFELQTRGAAQAMLAVWTEGQGWTDGDGNAIDRIEAPRDVEGEGLMPFTEFGSNASLTLRYFTADGEEVDFGTAERQSEAPRDRQCTPLSGRFAPVDAETDVTPWPNVAHPEGAYGDPLWAERTNEDLVAIFHCDHIHIYPEAAGEVELVMQAWDADTDSPMAESDPITFVVHEEEPEPAARFELQTRGAAQAMLGVWTEGEGWTDGEGNPIDRIEAPRDVEGEGLMPLTEFGNHASLTLRYFTADGEEVEFDTLERQQDAPRDRQCTPISGRFAPVDADTDVIPWPNVSHPEGAFGDPLFGERANGDLVAIFHCDHIYIVPEAAGETELVMQAWDADTDSPMAESDPITFVVHEDN